jgi:hypothetical protein
LSVNWATKIAFVSDSTMRGSAGDAGMGEAPVTDKVKDAADVGEGRSGEDKVVAAAAGGELTVAAAVGDETVVEKAADKSITGCSPNGGEVEGATGRLAINQ